MFEERPKSIEIDGLSIAYREAGKGAPLVLLHGWPMQSLEWRRQLQGLSDDYRVVAWDAPGAGQSSDPPETTRLDDWADWLAEFIQALDLGPCHLGGLSWGGGLALELYRRHPGLVRTLILVSAYAGWAGSLPADEVDRRLQLMRRNSRRPVGEWAPELISTLVAEDASPHLREELTVLLAGFHPAATRTALEAFARADLRDVLGGVDVPAFLLCGEKDVRAPGAVRQPLASGIADSELVVVPGVGHMVHMEAPERCNSEIRRFLARHAAV
ncbi:MAG: alpha/beta fold hydrolase [Actinomycetota bacterium]